MLDEATELSRFHTAKETAASQLRALYEKTRREIGEDEAMIIDVQMMMLDDGDYNDAVEEVSAAGRRRRSRRGRRPAVFRVFRLARRPRT